MAESGIDRKSNHYNIASTKLGGPYTKITTRIRLELYTNSESTVGTELWWK